MNIIGLVLLREENTLDKLVRLHLAEVGIVGFPDSDGEEGGDADRVGSMLGSYAIFDATGRLLVEPGCCCDLGNYEFWRGCATLDPGEVSPDTIGHAELTVRRDNDALVIDYPAAHGNPAETMTIEQQSLATKLSGALSESRDFQSRLAAQLGNIVEPMRGSRTEFVLNATSGARETMANP